MKIKILTLTGIRSEYDLLFPVLKALQEDDLFDSGVIISGAHLTSLHDYSYKQIEDDGFKIVEKIENLLYSNSFLGKTKSSAILMESLAQTLEREQPDYLMVLGDREESIIGALTANYMNIPVIHFAGGDNTNPIGGDVDEQVRHATSKLSHIHFTMRTEHSERLLKLGEEPWRVHTVGSGGVDRIRMVSNITKGELSKELGPGIVERYAVVIYHPLYSNLDNSAKEVENIFDSLYEENLRIFVGNPNSDPGFEDVIEVINSYKSQEKITIYNNLNRELFVNLLRGAEVLVGNSSLGLHEAPYLCLPSINVGERQRGRLAGNNMQFVSSNKEKIKLALEKVLYEKGYKSELYLDRYIYGDGHMAKKVVEIIKELPPKEQIMAKNITY